MLTCISASLSVVMLITAFVLRVMSRNMRDSGAPLSIAYEKATRRLSAIAFWTGLACGIVALAVEIKPWLFV